MDDFDVAVEKLKKIKYDDMSVSERQFFDKRCIEFKDYLMRNNLQYSFDSVNSWLDSLKATKSFRFIRKARTFHRELAKLVFGDDAVKIFMPRHFTDKNIQPLPAWANNVFSDFISNIEQYSESSKTQHEQKAEFKKFLAFASAHDAESVNDVSLLQYFEYMVEYPHYCQNIRSSLHYFPQISGSVFFTQVSKLHHIYAQRIVACKELAFSWKSDACREKQPISVSEFDRIMELIVSTGKSLNYSDITLEPCVRAKVSFGLFLETYDLTFSAGLASAWSQKLKECFNIRMYDELNFLLGVEPLFYKNHTPESWFINHKSKKHTMLMHMPEWMLQHYMSYRKFREENHLGKSTLSFDYLSVCRLSSYLHSRGCRDLTSITPQLLKDFNAADTDHLSVESKQAFNIKLKIFLKYLGMQGKIAQDLWKALPKSFAIRERPVKTLSDEQFNRLRQFCSDSKNSLVYGNFYRTAAIISLQLYTGMRLSDVLSLRFDNLKLSSMELVKVQQKTNVPVYLPLTNKVMNALINYLDKERPGFDSPFIFLTSKAPYRALESKTVSGYNALLSKICGAPVSSHVLRKTFASRLLQHSACSAEMISIMLGHQDLSNIHKYLDQREETLQICPINLNGIEYSGDAYGQS